MIFDRNKLSLYSRRCSTKSPQWKEKRKYIFYFLEGSICVDSLRYFRTVHSFARIIWTQQYHLLPVWCQLFRDCFIVDSKDLLIGTRKQIRNWFTNKELTLSTIKNFMSEFDHMFNLLGYSMTKFFGDSIDFYDNFTCEFWSTFEPETHCRGHDYFPMNMALCCDRFDVAMQILQASGFASFWDWMCSLPADKCNGANIPFLGPLCPCKTTKSPGFPTA